jgi:DNA repair ATPase RecN
MKKTFKTAIFYSLPIIFSTLLLNHAVGMGNGADTPPKHLMPAADGVGEQPMHMMESADAKRAQMQDRMQKRCDTLNTRIDERITRFEANKDKHLTHYADLVAKISEILQTLEAKGYDVAAAEAHVATLEGMISDYAAAYTEFIDLLVATQDIVCGESDGAFKGGVQSARDQLKVVHQKRMAVRDFYRNTLRVSLREIRSQVPVVVIE